MKHFILLCLISLGFSATVKAQISPTVPENWHCDARWKKPLIFSGRVKQITDFKGLDSEQPIPADFKYQFHKTVVFEVEKFYKGKNEKNTSNEVSIHTVSQAAGKPFEFKENEKYLVYAANMGVIPMSKSWIYATVVEADGLTATLEKSSEAIAFLESVYQIDFNVLRDVLGYRGDENVIKGGLVSGRATNLPKPAYPKEARKVKAAGTINVTVLIDENGKIILAKAVCPSNVDLAESAEQAAFASSFTPTLLSGKPVKVTGVIVYNFIP